MSLYNMLFGENEIAPALLAALGLVESNIPRFRDCFIQEDKIVIHTRTGGGNRDYYDSTNDENTDGPWNSSLTEHPKYLYDEDDHFDFTYANFYFSFPEEYAKDLEAIATKVTTPHA